MYKVEQLRQDEWQVVQRFEGLGEAEAYAYGLKGRWRIVRWLGGMNWQTVRISK